MPSSSAVAKNSLTRVTLFVNLYSVVGSSLCLFQCYHEGWRPWGGREVLTVATHFCKLQACFVYSTVKRLLTHMVAWVFSGLWQGTRVHTNSGKVGEGITTDDGENCGDSPLFF